MKTLNERFDYGLDLVLISIDEGITGYRDDSLETVKRNRDQYGLPLTILSYEELYGWTMDKIVDAVGRKNNCTFCGVFRRQALDRAGMKLKVDQIVSKLRIRLIHFSSLLSAILSFSRPQRRRRRGDDRHERPEGRRRPFAAVHGHQDGLLERRRR